MRALFTNFGFTESVFAAVAVTVILAFIFDAPGELVVALLALGAVTALVEHFLHPNGHARPGGPR